MVESNQLVPLQGLNLRDRAKQAIRDSIVTDEIQPGNIYPVSYFTSRLGVSATPVREALFDLASDGLIEPIRNRGFRIPELSEADLNEIHSLRLMLEVPSIVQLIEIMKAKDLSKFRKQAQQIGHAAEAGDLIKYLQLDREFHLDLIKLLDNRRLLKLVGRLRDQNLLYRLRESRYEDQLIVRAKEHYLILDAIEQHDKAEVERLVRQHLAHTVEHPGTK